MSPVAAIYLLWTLAFFGWLIAAALGKREPDTLHGRLGFVFHLVAVAAVLFLLTIVRPFPGSDLQYRLWDHGVPDGVGWVLVALVLAGFGFAGWGTVHRLSCLKHGAHVVDTGPYAVVRHPVYLGQIVAAVATAFVFGQVSSFLGAVVLPAALAVKVVLEEHAADDAAHRQYRRRVPMFVPYWPMGESDETSSQA